MSVVFLGAPIRMEAAAIIDSARDERMNESRHPENVGCGVVIVVERST